MDEEWEHVGALGDSWTDMSSRSDSNPDMGSLEHPLETNFTTPETETADSQATTTRSDGPSLHTLIEEVIRNCIAMQQAQRIYFQYLTEEAGHIMHRLNQSFRDLRADDQDGRVRKIRLELLRCQQRTLRITNRALAESRERRGWLVDIITQLEGRQDARIRYLEGTEAGSSDGNPRR